MKLILTKKEIDYFIKEFGVTEREAKKIIKEYSYSIEYATTDRLDDLMKDYMYKKELKN